MTSHRRFLGSPARWGWLLLLSFSLSLGPVSASILVQIGQNFTGSTYGLDSSYNPPDANGTAGPDTYVELINGRFTVYSKSTGERLQSMTGAEFWTSSGVSVDPALHISDPRLIYDPTAQRWFASAMDLDFADESSNRFLVAVSASANPTGSWTGFAFMGDPIDGNFADFPTLGLDANGIYLAAFMFAPLNGGDVGQTLVSIPKADLLAANPTIAHRTWFGILNSAEYGYVLQPVVNFDASPPNAPVLAVGDLGYDFMPRSNLVSFAVQNAAGPGPATLTTPTSLAVDEFSIPINPTQPDGNSTLDDGDTRFSANVYQVGGILYAVHGCEFEYHAALRWYKIKRADLTVLQSGTIADPNLDFFFGSIAANPSGIVVIGFNGCGTNTFVSSFAVVGETVDGVTTFGAPLLLKEGVTSYNRAGSSGISRWGDYSSTCVDPADPNRFWTLQLYPAAGGVWATQVTELLTAIPMLTIVPSGTNVIVSWPGTAIPFELQSVNAIDSTNWTIVSQGSAWTTNGLVHVQVPASAGAQFFRLHKLGP